MTALVEQVVVCDRCHGDSVERVWTDQLRSTPSIFRCTNSGCDRDEFLVLRLSGRIVHCGVPGVFAPKRELHSAKQRAQRRRAMDGLPPALETVIEHGLLRGAEYV